MVTTGIFVYFLMKFGILWIIHEGTNFILLTFKAYRLKFVNNQPDAQFFFMYVHFYSLHVSGSQVPIIRKINCINTTSGICHSV